MLDIIKILANSLDCRQNGILCSKRLELANRTNRQILKYSLHFLIIKAVIDIIGFFSVQNAAKDAGEDGEDVWNKFNHEEINEKFSNKPPVKAVEEKKRPAVPQRPAHTMSIYSTDIRPPALKPLSSLGESSSSESYDSTIALPGKIPEKSAPLKPGSALAQAEPVVSPKADYTDKPATSGVTPRPRPKAAGITVDEVVEKLSAVCNPVDPTKLYKNLIKVGQGYSPTF
jgi:hypothetical protein